MSCSLSYRRLVAGLASPLAVAALLALDAPPARARWVSAVCGEPTTCSMFAEIERLAAERGSGGGPAAAQAKSWAEGAARAIARCGLAAPAEIPECRRLAFEEAMTGRTGHAQALVVRTALREAAVAPAARPAPAPGDIALREAVARLQEFLIHVGYNVGAVDGVMGPRTLAATEHLANRIHVDGYTPRWNTAKEIDVFLETMSDMDLAETE